jgi:hypothetical protein
MYFTFLSPRNDQLRISHCIESKNQIKFSFHRCGDKARRGRPGEVEREGV